MDRNCQTCLYYQPRGVEEKDTGTCRRYPPTVVFSIYLTGNTESLFPTVHRGDFCGEWHQRKDAKDVDKEDKG